MDIEGVLGQVERLTEAGGAEGLVHFCMRGAGAEAIGVGFAFCRAGGRRGGGLCRRQHFSTWSLLLLASTCSLIEVNAEPKMPSETIGVSSILSLSLSERLVKFSQWVPSWSSIVHSFARGLDSKVLEAEIHDGCDLVPGGLVPGVVVAVAQPKVEVESYEWFEWGGGKADLVSPSPRTQVPRVQELCSCC